MPDEPEKVMWESTLRPGMTLTAFVEVGHELTDEERLGLEWRLIGDLRRYERGDFRRTLGAPRAHEDRLED